MKLPDISGLDRQRASFHIQHVLKQEQNELPQGHGIWYNLYRYADLKRCYSFEPVRYKVDRLLHTFAPNRPGTREAQLRLGQRAFRGCIIAVRVTGPILSSPRYLHAKALQDARQKADHEQLEREHRAWQARGGWRQNHPELNLDF
ncbi:hypothetical protein [Pseudomonas phage D6]|nr:hypothetical protein [Pseudomonas phage D6]